MIENDPTKLDEWETLVHKEPVALDNILLRVPTSELKVGFESTTREALAPHLFRVLMGTFRLLDRIGYHVAFKQNGTYEDMMLVKKKSEQRRTRRK